VDPENILLNLFVIFAAAKLSGEIFHRLHQPAVIGELLAGVVLGGGALGWIELGEPNESLSELGAVVLMFMVGLDTHPSDIRRVGGRSLAVAAAGIALPFALGGGYVLLSGGTGDESMFVAAAMAATSVGITARVLNELGVVHEIESRIILGAAIIDDILALIVLAIVSGSSSGDLSIASIAVLAFGALALVGMVGTFGPRVMSGAAPTVERARVNRGPLVASLALCLGLSALAGTIGLAAIVGAFLAGMALSEVAARWSLEEQVEPVYELVTPFFFVITGAHVDPTLFAESRTLGITLAVTGLAIAGKLAGGGGAAFGLGRRSMGIVGVGMVPRGEVGIIVASVGLAAGAISTELYGVIVAMSILTTLITPPLLKALFGDRGAQPVAGDEGRTEEIEGI
jgi:Kef-type K+ transport system membrane component KefB